VNPLGFHRTIRQTVRVRTRRLLRILLACAVAMVCLMGVLPVAVASALPLGQATLPVSQVFTSDSPMRGVDATFAYRLTPLDASNPMPAGSDASGYTFSITGNDHLQMGPINFTKTGVYTYELKNATPSRSGYTLDPRVYTIKFYITNDEDPLVIVYLENGEKAPTVDFDPSYHQGSVPADTVVVAGTKTWKYGTAPQSDRPDSISVAIKNGQSVVKEFTVTAAGGWKWSVQLPKNDAAGAAITYTVDEGNVPHYTHAVSGYNLLNTYKGPNYPGDLPKTGDSIPLLAGVLIASVIAGALIVFLLARRRKQADS